MIASTQTRPEFLQRVSVVHSRSRRVRSAALVAGTALVWLATLGMLAAGDFVFEWSWGIRAGLLGLVTLATLAGLVVGGFRDRGRRNPSRTAADLESAFPDLGQRARTTVQFGGRTAAEMRRSGVRPELVDALVQQTSDQSADLPLDEIVPRKRLWGAAGLLLLSVLGLGLGCLNWEWRTALSRTLLADTPYTKLTVTPGDVTVQKGAAIGISVDLRGRVDRDVVIRSRQAGANNTVAWTRQALLADSSADKDARRASFGVGLEGIESALVYRIEVDSLVSPEYRIDVLDPLTIQRVTAEVAYPAYTRLPVRTFSDGAISALRGSQCQFSVELSREPEEIQLTLQELPTKSHPQEVHGEITVTGPLVTFSLPIERNLLWTLSATTADGVSLEERPFRIRVTEDRPPKLAFDDPDDGIEVHTLAELPMRARASDDYGLTRSGIIFQISGSEEFTLLEEHFDEVLEAVEQAETPGDLTPRTRSVLERLLPLEHFALTQRDSVMYYAFAEDNRASEPQRTESDRRFIDIRPLLQTFRRRDDDGDGGGNDGNRRRLASLGQLIRRERAILNWTIKLSSRGESDDPRDVLSYDRLMRSQADVADLTRLLAERLQDRGIDDVDAFYQAEAVMLEAIDSLSVGDLETAVLQEKDAQQYLVEGRNRLEITLSNRPRERIDYQALRDLDAMILQRLRRNRNEADRNQQEAAQLIVSQLMRMARSEEQIAAQLAAVTASAGEPMAGADATSATAENQSGAAESGEPETADDPETEDVSDQSRSGDESEPPTEDDTAGAASADEAANSENRGTPDIAAIEERQFEILADARELAEEMANLDAITDLANERMTEVTGQLEETAQAIEGRETSTAEAGAEQSARELRELARQIVGLTQGDVMERIAFSRNLTADLTRRQRQVAESIDAEQPTDEKEPNADTATMRATDLAERARTLEDVLQAIASSTEQEEGEAADRVTVAMEERDLAGVRQRLADVAERMNAASAPASEESLPETDDEIPGRAAIAAEIRDTADSTERLAADLDQIYRQLLTPVIEQLRDLEQQAAELAERMEEPENERQAGQLAEDLEEFIEEMEQAGAGGASREELAELLQGGRGGALWQIRGDTGRLSLRAEYRKAFQELLEELQLELQELVLADTDLDADSPVPAKYAPLVERYLKVLSRRN